VNRELQRAKDEVLTEREKYNVEHDNVIWLFHIYHSSPQPYQLHMVERKQLILEQEKSRRLTEEVSTVRVLPSLITTSLLCY
jgi:hypothetical protein